MTALLTHATERLERARSLDTAAFAGHSVGNLPSEVNGFLGRESDLARLRMLSRQTRLLTLVGPSGVGKTRLALRMGAELRTDFPAGAWLVDLGPITDPRLLPQALGDVVGVRHAGQDWLGELTRALRAAPHLLILDNCECLIVACAELVDALLRACPNLQVLATSLQPLGASGETLWRVRPLDVPVVSASSSTMVADSDAVRLFVARVQAHMPDFALGQDNAAAIADICRRVDGLPLALELVAARVETLGLAQVAARLERGLEVANGSMRNAPARQRTLQAALDWTWSLLELDECLLARRLGVFLGGWTLEAAEAVCAGEGLDESSVVNVLARLVTKSLVVADHADLTVRYRFLETLRTHALAQLATAGETDQVQRRHAAYMLSLAERARPRANDAAQAELLVREENNLRAALEWAIAHDAAEAGMRLGAAAFSLWWFNGHYLEGLTWLERLMALPSAPEAPAPRALAQTYAGQFHLMLGDYALAQEQAQAALHQFQAISHALGSAIATQLLGNIALQLGDLKQARVLQTDCVRRLHDVGSPGEVIGLVQLALIASEHGDLAELRRLVAAIEAFESTRSSPMMKAEALHLRGLLEASEGASATAGRLIEQAVAVRRPTRDQQGLVRTLTSLGHVRLDQGQSGAALAAFAEAVELARASGERVRVIRALEGYARCVAKLQPDAAVRLAGAADGQRESLGTLAWPGERSYLQVWLADARRTLGPTAYQSAWEDGHASSLEQAISFAEALGVGASAVSLRGVLSRREQEVAGLLAQGLTNKQIAAALVVSPATVRSHVEHILDKLDLRSRAQIAVWASQEGLLQQ